MTISITCGPVCGCPHNQTLRIRTPELAATYRPIQLHRCHFQVSRASKHDSGYFGAVLGGLADTPALNSEISEWDDAPTDNESWNSTEGIRCEKSHVSQGRNLLGFSTTSLLLISSWRHHYPDLPKPRSIEDCSLHHMGILSLILDRSLKLTSVGRSGCEYLLHCWGIRSHG